MHICTAECPLTVDNVYDNFFEVCAARTHTDGRMDEVTFSCSI